MKIREIIAEYVKPKQMIDKDCWFAPNGTIYPVLYGSEFFTHGLTATKIVGVKVLDSRGKALPNFETKLTEAYFALLKRGYARIVFELFEANIEFWDGRMVNEGMPEILERLPESVKTIIIEWRYPRGNSQKLSRKEAEETLR